MRILKVVQSEGFMWLMPVVSMLGAFISVASGAYDMGQSFLGIGIVLWFFAFLVKDIK